jgi:hypothetical protein
MFYKLMTTLGATLFTLGFMHSAMAEQGEQEALAPATVVVYRAQELSKTERISLDVHVDESSLGRLGGEDTLIVSGAAGQYTLGTSIAGTEPLVIDLKPGSTHYVKTELKLRGTTVKVRLVEVEEQVAKVQNPALSGAI